MYLLQRQKVKLVQNSMQTRGCLLRAASQEEHAFRWTAPLPPPANHSTLLSF